MVLKRRTLIEVIYSKLLILLNINGFSFTVRATPEIVSREHGKGLKCLKIG